MTLSHQTKNPSERKNKPPGLGFFKFPETVISSAKINPAIPRSALIGKQTDPAKKRFRKIEKIRAIVFVFLLIILVITFFTKNRFKSVAEIVPEVFQTPVQTPADDNRPIVFEKDGFSYKLTPLFDYDIAGLVAHSLEYDAWYSISRTDTVFPVDLCLIWGKNVESRAYQAKSLSVRQDYRFCLFNYSGDVKFSGNELSNNHLVITDTALEKVAKSINAGDQVHIRGKLVNVEARVIGAADRYESSHVAWNSSTSREDTGAGACEVIFVEELEILKKGNPASHFLFTLSGYGLAIITVWWATELILSSAVRRKKPNRDSETKTLA